MLEDALRSGAEIRAFRSGGGLRVVRVEKDGGLIAYGEAPNIEEAIIHAEKDLDAGGRPLDHVYLTGSCSPSSPLDAWILHGHTFSARFDLDSKSFVALLSGIEVLLSGVVEEQRKTGNGATLMEAITGRLVWSE